MKRVYIAGPITKGILLHNIRQADAAFQALVQAGFAPLNPVWSVYAGGAWEIGDTAVAYALKNSSLPLDHDDWLAIDLPWVGVSDAVLRLPGESTGADRETAFARSLGIPVYEDIRLLIIGEHT